MKSIYVKHHGTIYGPYHHDKVLSLYHSGFFRNSDTACLQGEMTWEPLSAFFNKPDTQPGIGTVSPGSQSRRYLPLLLFCTVFLSMLVGGSLLLLHQRALRRSQAILSAPANTLENKAAIQADLDVEITIPGKNGSVMKPQGVQVLVFPLGVLQGHLAGKSNASKAALLRLQPEVQSAKAALNETESPSNPSSADNQNDRILAMQRYQRLVKEASRYLSAAYYFENMPNALASCKTAADGRFSLHLPGSGDLGLAATVTGDDGVSYYWLLAVPGTAQDTQRKVVLTQANHTTVRSSDSLILTLN